METIRITYPPNIFFESTLERFGGWPTESFSWLDGLMRPSDARTDVSPGLLQYHAHVLGDAFINPGLTRTVAAVEAIMYFLQSQVGLENGGNLLELCAGTGILTTPLGAYFDVVAIEKQKEFVTPYKRYLARVGLEERIRVLQGDVTQTEWVLDNLASRDFKAMLMNGPWKLTRHCLEIAKRLSPSVVIAVLPLDVIEETDKSRSYRFPEGEETIDENRQCIASFRDDSGWDLLAVEPALRHDGTAQIGTLLFAREQAGW